ncbi:hypothetical protein D3C75_629030 [compost metagenome]
MQHGGHLPRGDAFAARQAGAVLHHQVRGADALAGQPLVDGAVGGAGVVAIAGQAVACADRQEQLASHGVVAVLVDVADHLDHVRRKGLGEQTGIARGGAEAVLAGDGAAQLAPQRAHRASGKGRVVEQ